MTSSKNKAPRSSFGLYHTARESGEGVQGRLWPAGSSPPAQEPARAPPSLEGVTPLQAQACQGPTWGHALPVLALPQAPAHTRAPQLAPSPRMQPGGHGAHTEMCTPLSERAWQNVQLPTSLWEQQEAQRDPALLVEPAFLVRGRPCWGAALVLSMWQLFSRWT